MNATYEVVDASDDESYYPLGFWPTLEEAIAAVEACKEPSEFNSDAWHDTDQEYFKVEIREHAFGWSGHGKKVFVREWVQVWDEDADEGKWEVRRPNAKVSDLRPDAPK